MKFSELSAAQHVGLLTVAEELEEINSKAQLFFIKRKEHFEDLRDKISPLAVMGGSSGNYGKIDINLYTPRKDEHITYGTADKGGTNYDCMFLPVTNGAYKYLQVYLTIGDHKPLQKLPEEGLAFQIKPLLHSQFATNDFLTWWNSPTTGSASLTAEDIEANRLLLLANKAAAEAAESQHLELEAKREKTEAEAKKKAMTEEQALQEETLRLAREKDKEDHRIAQEAIDKLADAARTEAEQKERERVAAAALDIKRKEEDLEAAALATEKAKKEAVERAEAEEQAKRSQEQKSREAEDAQRMAEEAQRIANEANKKKKASKKAVDEAKPPQAPVGRQPRGTPMSKFDEQLSLVAYNAVTFNQARDALFELMYNFEKSEAEKKAIKEKIVEFNQKKSEGTQLTVETFLQKYKDTTRPTKTKFLANEKVTHDLSAGEDSVNNSVEQHIRKTYFS